MGSSRQVLSQSVRCGLQIVRGLVVWEVWVVRVFVRVVRQSGSASGLGLEVEGCAGEEEGFFGLAWGVRGKGR